MDVIPSEVLGALFQTAGAACAKFGLGAKSFPVAAAVRACEHFAPAPLLPLACDAAAYAMRAAFCGLLLLCNAYGMMLYLQGMSRSGSLRATVLNTAAGTLCTAAVGAAVFGEVLSLKWGAGASLIGVGVVLISASSGGSAPSPGAREADAAAALERPALEKRIPTPAPERARTRAELRRLNAATASST